MHASDLWESSSPRHRWIRAGLLPASWLYAVGWEVYLTTYALGIKKPKAPHHPVICVGNLRVGGSGKTPITRFLARHLIERGLSSVISSSGYGSPRAESASVAPEGPLSPSEWGDEAAMLRWLEPNIPLIVGRRRVRAAELARERFPDHVLIMDDGFQHLPLAKDLTILLDPLHPPNSHCLPAGPYREPRFNRRRADLLVPGDLTAVAQPTRLVSPDGGEHRPDHYSVLCALGNPSAFLADLAIYFPSVAGFGQRTLKGDHDPLSEGNLLDSFPRQLPIVVTAKDWVKIRERSDVGNYDFLIATQEVRLEPIEVLERRLPNPNPR